MHQVRVVQACENQSKEDSSSSDPFSSGKESWLGVEESSSESSCNPSCHGESKKHLQEIIPGMKDRQKAQWSLQRDAIPMRDR